MQISNGISAAMVVGNEVKFIKRAIESILPLCDEVVVYLDCHSNDGTKEILEGMGSKIKIHQNWYDDKIAPINFSKARNESLKLCGYSWTFILDGDERMEGDPQKLRDFLMSGAVKDVVYKLAVKQNIGEHSAAEFTQPRIFPTRKGVTYHGSVHNQPTWPKTMRVAEINVSIIHDGASDPQKHEQRKQRTAVILKDILERIDSGNGEIVDYYNAVKMLMVVERPEESYRYGTMGMRIFNAMGIEDKRKLNRYLLAIVRCLTRIGKWDEVPIYLNMHRTMMGDSVDACFFSFACNYRRGNFIGAYCDGLKYLELLTIEKNKLDRFESTLMYENMVAVTLDKIRHFIDIKGTV